MRNFFEQQERARRNTAWLVFLFLIAVVGIATGVYFAALAILSYPGFRPPDTPPPVTSWWEPELFLSFFIGTLVIIIFASLLRAATLRGGGPAVAEMLGGRLVSPGAASLHERRLLNVVEEMALASSMPVPQVYVLDGEPGINAFAAGHSPDDAAVVVTRGCLEKLSRDELQGVVAHEFSHILNGDSRLKLQLIGILFGILVIHVIGRGILRFTRVSGRSSERGRGAVLVAVVSAGLALAILGYIGLFCGRLIKAAVSRQREYLADAAAVQFTRDPAGIGGALKKIGGYLHGSRVTAGAAEETSHLFFSTAVSYAAFSSLFATHPPLAERIHRIDPSFDGRFPEVGEGAVAVAEEEAGGAASTRVGFAGRGAPGTIPAADVVPLVGRPGPEHARHAAALLRSLPAAVQDAVRDPFASGGLIFALLLSPDRETQGRQRERIKHHSGERFLQETLRLAAGLSGFDPRWRLPVVQLALPALRQMTPDQQERFARTVAELISADAQVTVFEHALSGTLLRSLAASRGRREPPPRVSSLAAVQEDCAALLSLLAHTGQNDAAAAQRAFASGVRRLGPAGETMRLLPAAPFSGPGLDRALTGLRRTVPRLRERVLDACAHTVLDDRRVTVEEAELLRVVADTLDCPLPPFFA